MDNDGSITFENDLKDVQSNLVEALSLVTKMLRMKHFPLVEHYIMDPIMRHRIIEAKLAARTACTMLEVWEAKDE